MIEIIGKLYIDSIYKDCFKKGKSYIVNNYSFGGFANLFTDNYFSNHYLDPNNLKIHCISQESLSERLFLQITRDTKYNFHNYELDVPNPCALIIEDNETRTSFVLFDQLSRLELYKENEYDCLIYYADKIRINNLNPLKTYYLDTAGNNYNDLFYNLENFYKNSILSISSEYLDKKLLDKFLYVNEFIVIAHNPKITTIYTNEKTVEIKNDFYVNPKNLKFNKTGLGDKFFYIFANYNQKDKYSIEDSVLLAQKDVSNFLRGKYT